MKQKKSVSLSELRILFVSDAIYGRNGVGTYYKDLVDHLRPLVGRVGLVCPGHPKLKALESYSLAMPGDKTQRLFMPHFRKIKKLLGSFKPHVIVCATPGPYGFYSMRYARLNGIGTCVGHHTDFESLAAIYFTGPFGSFSKAFMEWLHRQLFKRGEAVVTTSENMLEFLQRAGAPDARLIGTPIARRFLEKPVSAISGPLDKVLFVGRLAPEKNLEAVVEAASKISDLQFIIAGDGPLRPLVEEAAQRCSNIDYRGWVDQKQVIDLMDEAQMLLLPSHVESFGTVALEAMARQRMVLVSGNCGISEWKNLSQELITMMGTETLTETILRAKKLSDQERIQKAKASQQGVQEFIDQTVKDWLSVLPIKIET